MIKEITEYLIPPNMSLKETIEVIEKGAAQFALVVNSEKQLLGTVTDGDIRRGLLKGETLESSVCISCIINLYPYQQTVPKPELYV